MWSRHLVSAKTTAFVPTRTYQMIHTFPRFKTLSLWHIEIASACELWEGSYNHKPTLQDLCSHQQTPRPPQSDLARAGLPLACISWHLGKGTQRAALASCAVFSKWIWKEQCIFHFPGQTPWHLRLMILCKIIRGLDTHHSGALGSQTALMCRRTKVIIVRGMCDIFPYKQSTKFYLESMLARIL